MNLFSIENLSHRYGERTVLDIPHLDIEEGGLVCLTGANGSGKSTLLNLLAGLMVPFRGRVLYREMDLFAMPGDMRDTVRREMGICLQSPYLFRSTVESNVSYGLAIKGVPGPERDRRAASALRDVGLDGFSKRHHHELSGGEVQRVALARALAPGPRVLLLDEPMANVDAATRILLERILAELTVNRGITAILTTHDTEQAFRMGSRIITLHEGSVVESGMGNIYHGRLRREAGQWIFDTGLCEFIVPPQKTDARTAVVPPESIVLSLGAPETSARNIHQGRVIGIRMRNGSVEVTVNAGEEFTARITQASLERLGIRLESSIHVIFKSEAVRLY